jgi:hypothetical protein
METNFDLKEEFFKKMNIHFNVMKLWTFNAFSKIKS